MILQFALLGFALFLWIYVYSKHCFDYWKHRNVPTLPATFPFGNFKSPLSSHSWGYQLYTMYNKFKEMKVKHAGIYQFTRPTYMPIDLSIVKDILVNDNLHFDSRGAFKADYQIVSTNVSTLDGDEWRNSRKKISPTLSSSKIKMMFPLVVNCTKSLVAEVKKFNESSINALDLLSKFTMNVIGTCAFGIECNAFESSGAELMNNTCAITEESLFRSIMHMLCFVMPKVAKKLRIMPYNRKAGDFFCRLFSDTVRYRVDNSVRRLDYMQILIDLLNENDAKERFVMADLQGQAFFFFAAGYETTAAGATYCLYELSRNIDIQNKLREEISSVLEKYKGECSYTSLNEMTYLKPVIEEASRLYPAIPHITRQCTADYKISESNTIIEKGTLVCIPIMGIHRDERYFENPEKFDPDRFDANREHIQQCSFLSFGDGPRKCIGEQFGIFQIKAALVSLLMKFKFTLDERTSVPMEFSHTFFLHPKKPVWLKVEAIL